RLGGAVHRRPAGCLPHPLAGPARRRPGLLASARRGRARGRGTAGPAAAPSARLHDPRLGRPAVGERGDHPARPAALVPVRRARGTSLQGRSVLAWQPGWAPDGHGILWFWLFNTGLFVPVLLAAVWMEARSGDRLGRRRLRFWLPSVLWFVVPNLLRLSPWIW